MSNSLLDMRKDMSIFIDQTKANDFLFDLLHYIIVAGVWLNMNTDVIIMITCHKKSLRTIFYSNDYVIVRYKKL